MKVNLYYDWIGPNGPIGNGLAFDKFFIHNDVTDNDVLRYPGFYYHLKKLGIDISAKSISEKNILKSKYNFFIIEIHIMNNKNENHFIKYLDERIVSLLHKEQINRFVIFYPNEGFPLSMRKRRSIKQLHDIIKDKGIPLSKVVFIFGDLRIKENYDELFNSSDRFGKVIGLNWWEPDYQRQLRHRWFGDNLTLREKEFIEEAEINLASIRQHHYLSLNGNIRAHRTIIVSELKRRDVFKKGLVSYLGRYHEELLQMKREYSKIQFKEEYREALVYLKSYIQNWQPDLIDIDVDGLRLDDRQQTKDMYLNTYFSLVTESHVDENILFITEKTYKPIVNLHPFIIAGCQGTLKYLRGCGYKTFPEIFDESYDEEENPEKRMYMILNEMERVCSKPLEELRDLYKQAWPKLLHNRKLFFEKDHKETFIDLLKEIA